MSYEYLNDLAVRDAIAVIQSIVPVECFTPYSEPLASLDQRLRLQYPPGVSADSRWWSDGLPICIAE